MKHLILYLRFYAVNVALKHNFPMVIQTSIIPILEEIVLPAFAVVTAQKLLCTFVDYAVNREK